MTLTPRQIAAYLEFADKIDRIERALDLQIVALGAQGDDKTRKQAITELTR